MKTSPSASFQVVLGVVYTAAGIGVFLMLPRRMAQITEATGRDPGSLDMLFLWFCFGLIGVLLIGGGLRKLLAWYRSNRKE
ncbi:MAG: hypothetical protein ACOWWM_05445 [Desulfobacterales bacterium]